MSRMNGDPRQKPDPLYFDDFFIGQTFDGSGKCSGSEEYRLCARRVTPESIAEFARSTGDTNPLHREDAFARDAGLGFSGRIAHGFMVTNWINGMVSEAGIWDGTLIAFLGFGGDFRAPAYPGDILLLELVVAEKREVKKESEKRGLVRFNFCMRKLSGGVVVEGFLTVLILKNPKQAG